VNQAAGVNMRDLPLTAESIWRAMQERDAALAAAQHEEQAVHA